MMYEHTTNGIGIKCVCTGNSSVGELAITNESEWLVWIQLNFCIISSYVQ